MSRFNDPLNNVRVASPCSADWDAMIGNELSRFCGQCNLNVYNLSGMTRAEAEHLIAGHAGRLCVRFYRRADGSILTRNCPVGLRAVQQRVSKFTRAVVSSVLGFVAGIACFNGVAGVVIKGRLTRSPMMGDIAIERLEPPLLSPQLIGTDVPVVGKMFIGGVRQSTETRQRRTRASRF